MISVGFMACAVASLDFPALRGVQSPSVSCTRIRIRATQENGGAWSLDIGKAAPKLSQRPLQVVLVSPQIPGNTGAIARTCAAALVGLHLVKPLGFSIEDTKLKRAGLDYWPYVVVEVHDSWTDFLGYLYRQEGDKRLIGFSKNGQASYLEIRYRPGDWLIFGSETEGLSPEVLDECSSGALAGGTACIPIDQTHVRSLNLSVAAGVGVYEALRQLHADTIAQPVASWASRGDSSC